MLDHTRKPALSLYMPDELADAGHYGYLEWPEEFNKIVIESLDRVEKA